MDSGCQWEVMDKGTVYHDCHSLSIIYIQLVSVLFNLLIYYALNTYTICGLSIIIKKLQNNIVLQI